MGSIYAHKSLLLALILNSSSHASYSEGDVNVISLRGLVKAIFLFEGAKRRVFWTSVINCINNGLRFSAINY